MKKSAISAIYTLMASIYKTWTEVNLAGESTSPGIYPHRIEYLQQAYETRRKTIKTVNENTKLTQSPSKTSF